MAPRSGDHVASIVAGERQREGSLKAGKIARVYREIQLFFIWSVSLGAKLPRIYRRR